MLSFAENPDADGKWAKSHENQAEGLRLLAAVLETGEWARAPTEWMHHLSWPWFWEAPTVAAAVEIRSCLITKITSGKLTDEAHAVLPGLFNTRVLAPLHDAEAICTWLHREAGANDATVIAEVVQQSVYSRDERLVADMFPLVGWLLTKGSRELRSNRRTMLVAELLPVVLQHGSDDQLAAAVRYVLWNENKVGTDGWGHQTVEKLRPAVERLLTKPEGKAIVGDLMEAIQPAMFEVYVQTVLQAWAAFPLTRAEIIRRLGLGEIKTRQTNMTWGIVVMGPPVEVVLRDPDVARVALDGLFWGSSGTMTHIAVPQARDKSSWGSILVKEFIRATGALATKHEPDLRLIQKCVGHTEALSGSICQGLREAVTQAEDASLAKVKQMLDSAGTSSLVADPALELLIGSAPSSRTIRKDRNLDHVLAAIQQAVDAGGKTFCGFSFRDHLHGAERIELSDLEDERAFLIKDGVLKVSRSAIDGLCNVTDDPEEQKALGVLYAVHEVVHDFQGIAEKKDVSTVRFAGAESALMHVDLGADHVAATMTGIIYPEWRLDWLKDLQGKSIRGFAATARNPPYSRVRKVLRLVGLRTDLALRRPGIGKEHLTPESFGFADFSPGGGAFIAMVNRPPFVVVKVAQVTAADVGVFFEGIDGTPGVIERVDEIIERVLQP